MAESDAGAGGGERRPRSRETDYEVVPYNFLRPPRISKDRRLTLEAIFSRIAAAVQATLSSRLRTPLDVVPAVEQASFAEFVLGASNPCAAFVFDLGGAAGGQGVIDLGPDLAFFIVDRIFGGPGEALAVERPLTMLERTVVRGLVDKMVAAFREAWTGHLDLTPELTGFESTPDMLRIASREANVLVARLEVRAGTFQSYLAFCLPLLALETFLAEKAHRSPLQSTPSQESPAHRRVVQTALLGAHVEVAARFPGLRLAARDVANLRVGQIIQTTQPIEAPVELHINGRCRFAGTLGQYRRTLGLRVTQATRVGVAAGGRGSRGRIQ